MNARQSLVAAVALVLGIMIGTALNRPSVGQQANNIPQPGRFLMRGIPAEASSTWPTVVVTDSATGQSSAARTDQAGWTDLGVPGGRR